MDYSKEVLLSREELLSDALKKSKENYQIVVGIDFGTSRSGFAWAWMPDQSHNNRDIRLNTSWPSQPDGIEYVKTPTLLLRYPNNNVAWGHQVKRILEEHKNKEQSEYHLFERFKMNLYSKIEHCGEEERFKVVDVIADYLKLLKDYALKTISGKGSLNIINPERILWCLTVPAMWENSAKESMINASIKAGLIDDRQDYGERLVFVLEPEAAAMYCQNEDKVTAPVPKLSEDTRFMVVDAGGGTVDITVHEVTSSGLEAVVKHLGKAHGSTEVDKDFHNYLSRLMGSDAVKNLAKNKLEEYFDLLNRWEQKKCAFDEDQIEREANSRILMSGRLMKALGREALDKLGRAQDGEDDAIVISPNTMKSIFENTLVKLLSTIDEVFKDLGKEKCNYLFLVGGFSQSPLLRERVRRRYEGTAVDRVVVPDNAGSAVLWGSVAFGIDPSVIRSRSSRLTYGIETRNYFNEMLDDPSKKVYDKWEKIYRCDGRFDMFVKAGDIVDVGRKVVRRYCISPGETRISIRIYSTTKEAARYVDEDGVSKEGEFVISTPDTTDGKKKELEVTMDFSDNLIIVTAEDVNSGNTCQTEARFSNTFY